jgi:hypothetical protein
MKYDLSKASKDKKLAKEVGGISDVSKFSFVRKPHASKAGRKPGKKPGRKAAGKKKAPAGRKKATLADKRKAAGRVPGAKPARRGRPKK